MFNQLIRQLRQAALCGLVLAIGAERAAAQTAVDGTTFTYGNTVFDIAVDPDSAVLDDRIFVARTVPWIRDLYRSVPELATVHNFQIQYLEPRKGVFYPWIPDRALQNDLAHLPDNFRPDNYTTATENSAFLYFTEESSAYFLSCVWGPGGIPGGLMSCSVIIKYALDTDIRLIVRLDPVDRLDRHDFREIAIKAHRFVRCELDVTDPASLRTSRPASETIPEFLAPCEAVIS